MVLNCVYVFSGCVKLTGFQADYLKIIMLDIILFFFVIESQNAKGWRGP